MRIFAAYYFLTFLSFSVFTPYTSLYFSEKGFDNTKVGIILSLWAFVSVIAQPVMGIMSDRMGNPRKLIMISVAAAPILGLGFQFTDHFSSVIALSVCFIWFQSSFGPLSDAIAVEKCMREGFSFGSIRLWGALSYSLGTFGTGFLYEKYGYDHIFLYYLLISVLVLACLLRFPNSRLSSPPITLFEQAKQVFVNKRFMVFVGISLLLVLSWTSSSTFLPIYFKDLGFDMGLLGSAFALGALVEVPVFWIAARISRKIGTFYLLALAAAVFGLRCLMLFLFHNEYLTIGLQALDGISFAFAAGTLVEVVEGYASAHTKATFQTVFAAASWGLGGIIGNAAGGVIVDAQGAPFLFLLLFILCASASLLFACMKQTSAIRKADMN